MNHKLMVICCIIMVLAVMALISFGLEGSYLFILLLPFCPLMHIFMMKDEHKEHSDNEKSCH